MEANDESSSCSGSEMDEENNSVANTQSAFRTAWAANHEELLKSLLMKNSPLFSLNPQQLYALQLAQLQAALTHGQQQMAEAKADREDSNREADKKAADAFRKQLESPLDLSGVKSQGNNRAMLERPWEGSHFKQQSPEKNPLAKMGEIARMQRARHSAWQSQWVSRGPELNKDIFKCVTCRDSFPSLQALTTHMKETRHFQPKAAVDTRMTSSPTVLTYQLRQEQQSVKRDLLKEQLPMPRKLVRGQDVWLGRGEEQTRNILKCMYCGQSFRSLDALTVHMQETKHYKKVISQEQISSWKEDPTMSAPVRPANDQIGTVLSCKVCGESFTSLKQLSDHIVKSRHYGVDGRTKMRFSGSSDAPVAKKSKSLPVKALLEIERSRMQQQLQLDSIEQKHSSSNSPVARSDSSANSSSSSSGAERRTSKSSEDAKSFRSILGSLEEMVHHNNNVGGRRSADEESSHLSPPPSLLAMSPPTIFNTSAMLTPTPKTAAAKGEKNPLAALQHLCDSTQQQKTKSAAVNSRGGDVGSPGSILAFSWACNQAMDSSGFKCPFCETPFTSKGAYRHHLSKTHFMKEGDGGRTPSNLSANEELTQEDSQSKYHKYAELAKQLSNTTAAAAQTPKPVTPALKA